MCNIYFVQTLSEAVRKFKKAKFDNPWEIFKVMQLTAKQQVMKFIELNSYLDRLHFLIEHPQVNREFNTRYVTSIPKKYRIAIHDVTNAFGVSLKVNMTKVGATYFWNNPPMRTRSAVKPLSLQEVLTAVDPLPAVTPVEFQDQLPVKGRRTRNTYTKVQDRAILQCVFDGTGISGRINWADIVWSKFAEIREANGWTITNQQMKDRHRHLTDKNPQWAAEFVTSNTVVQPVVVKRKRGPQPKAPQSKKQKRVSAQQDSDSEDESIVSWNPDAASEDEASVNSQDESLMSEVRLCFIPKLGITFHPQTGDNFSSPSWG